MRGLAPRRAMNLLLLLSIPVIASAAALTPLPAPVAYLPLAFALSDTAAVNALFDRADRYLRAGAPDSVLVLVDPLAARAVADGDLRNELRARLHQAGALALSGRLREADGVCLEGAGQRLAFGLHLDVGRHGAHGRREGERPAAIRGRLGEGNGRRDSEQGDKNQRAHGPLGRAGQRRGSAPA